MESGIVLFLLLGAALFIYFIPTWVAWGKRNADAVCAVNFFLGWTFLGWVVALVMALTPDSQVIVNKVNQESKLDKLGKLKGLLDKGALTEVEYNREKEKILNQ